ncbi:hypothetical protein H0H93_008755 [Arthromyces matolae]|nr:hypothetical protein H0H93_008755 [Arthromyces matolae]
MPYLPSDISVEIFSNPKQLPRDAWELLEAHPRRANVVLPQALGAGEGFIHHNNGDSSQLWMVCRTYSEIEFILSATDGPMGTYPIFIFTPLPYAQLMDDEHIRPCIRSLITALGATVPWSRVYSVFSVEPVALVFADEWTRYTGIRLASDPIYYAAKLSHCTSKSLDRCDSATDLSRGFVLRPAKQEDIDGIGELCYLFARDSEPFTLTRDRAQLEAAILVAKEQIWVHEARRPGGKKEIASIVAFTRNSNSVAAITKVCTNERWQRQGCAERLVRKVCEHFLTGPKPKESVVLYVAHDNIAANIVYNRVGFIGLAPNASKAEVVDRWLEIGFDREKIVLGHW